MGAMYRSKTFILMWSGERPTPGEPNYFAVEVWATSSAFTSK